MLKVILNILQPQTEEIIAEQQAEGASQNKYSISGSSARNTAASAESLPCLHRRQEGL